MPLSTTHHYHHSSYYRCLMDGSGVFNVTAAKFFLLYFILWYHQGFQLSFYLSIKAAGKNCCRLLLSLLLLMLFVKKVRPQKFFILKLVKRIFFFLICKTLLCIFRTFYLFLRNFLMCQ